MQRSTTIRRRVHSMRRSPALLLTLILLCAGNAFAETKYADRFVWVFGWNLRQDKQLDEIEPVLATAAEHGLNGRAGTLRDHGP